jgi:cell division septal protein FtsQ
MRVLITVLTSLSVGALLAVDNPQGFRQVLQSMSTSAAQLWNDKELRIDGLHVLSRAEVEKLLPLTRSVPWWHLNATEIQAQLGQMSWVQEASIESCPDSWASRWGCFVVRIKERQPMFLATFEGNSWVIDREGSFLVPHRELEGRNFAGRLISVKGLAETTNSPDLVRAQLSAASRVCDTIEKEVAKSIGMLEFMGQGDFAVSFNGLPFPVVFAGGSDAKVPLAEQGVRCAALLKQLRMRYDDVAKIDLAFDRVGVVQFRPAAVAEKSAVSGQG